MLLPFAPCMHKYVQIEVFSAGVAYQPEIIPYISFVNYI